MIWSLFNKQIRVLYVVGLFHSTRLQKMERITTSNPTFKIRSQKVQPFIGQIALQVDVPTKSCVVHYLSRIPKKDHTNRYLPFFCVKGVSEPKILSRYGICKHHNAVIVLCFSLAVMRLNKNQLFSAFGDLTPKASSLKQANSLGVAP